MSADSLFAIVPTAPPVAAPKAADARGDSGFDRMLDKAMDVEPEQTRAVGRADSPLTRTGTNTTRTASTTKPAAEPDTGSPTAADATPADDDDTQGAGSASDTVSPLPSTDAADSQITDDDARDGTVAAGTDAPQGLQDGAALPVAPPIETPPAQSLNDAKGAGDPQILPGPADAGPAPEPAVSTKGTDGPQVLPGITGKTDGPQVLPGAPDKTDEPQVLPAVTNKAEGPQVLPAAPARNEGPQILPGVVPLPITGKSADRQVLPGTNALNPTDPAAEPAAPAATAAGAKAAATAAAAAMAPAVAPPPLRPLTERTGTVSNSVRATGDSGTGKASAAVVADATVAPAGTATPTLGGTSTVPDATALSDRPLTPGVNAPTVPVADTPDVDVKSRLDQQPGEALPAPTTQTSTPSQAYSLSNMSSAAVEATAQMAAQMIRRLDSRSTRFEMALTPDDLGRVDVSLDIDENGRLAARLAFDNPAAALDMKGRVDDLRRQLEQAGFQLADDAFQFTERDRSSGEAFDRRQGRAFAAASRLSAETDAAVPVTAPRWMSLSLTPDRVDMKV